LVAGRGGWSGLRAGEGNLWSLSPFHPACDGFVTVW
jgi:hypothetical protein